MTAKGGENEVIMLVISIFALIFIFFGFNDIKKVKGYKILLLSFFVFFSSTVFTVLESYFLGTFLNYLEHICNLVSLILIFYWFNKFTVK